MNRLSILPFLFDVAIGVYDPAADKYHLPPLNVDPQSVTIGGYSAGSASSMSAHVAYSSVFKGVSLMNGGLYARGNKEQFIRVIAASELPDE